MPEAYSVDPANAGPERPCPRCGQAMPGLTTVCSRCGHDRAAPASSTAKPSAGDAPSAPKAPGEMPDFVPPSPTRTKAFLIIGGVLTLAAAIATIYYHGQTEAAGIGGFLRQIGRAVLTLYNIGLHTGTGVAALWVTARATGHRFGSFEAAVSRMFVLVAGFFLIMSIQLPLGSISGIASILLAAGLYWLLAVVVLGRKPEHVNLLGFVHLVMFAIIYGGTLLYGTVSYTAPETPARPAATQPAPAATPAPPANPTGSAGG